MEHDSCVCCCICGSINSKEMMIPNCMVDNGMYLMTYKCKKCSNLTACEDNRVLPTPLDTDFQRGFREGYNAALREFLSRLDDMKRHE